jgi:RNA 3'-terminal phosphate cyclase
MSSTFTLPLRLNTRQTTSNDGTISADNTGAAMISQQSAIVAGAATTEVIPAGSIIHSIDGYLNVVGAASRAVSLTVNGVTTAVGTLTTTVLGKVAVTFTASAAVANLLANVGAYNCTVTLASEAASAGTLSVQYTGRNQDGSIIAYGSGYSNN